MVCLTHRFCLIFLGPTEHTVVVAAYSYLIVCLLSLFILIYCPIKLISGTNTVVSDDRLYRPDIVGVERVSLFRVITVYRPNNTDALTRKLTDATRSLFPRKLPAVIVGDFNCPDIDWINLQPSENIHNHLFEFFTSNGFTRYVTDPTRIINIAYIVLSNDHALLANINVVQPFANSDQSTVQFRIIKNKTKTNGCDI